jgi:hypothetical protein
MRTFGTASTRQYHSNYDRNLIQSLTIGLPAAETRKPLLYRSVLERLASGGRSGFLVALPSLCNQYPAIEGVIRQRRKAQRWCFV